LIDLEIHTKGPPQRLPPPRFDFPDARRADSNGLVGYGADFAAETVISAYVRGIFPWPHDDAEMLWFSPDPRTILPVAGLHIPRRLQRTIRGGRFRVTLDAAFERVIAGCADRPEGTWITPRMIDSYVRLHELGWAHSFEVWSLDGNLAGGLYGVAVGSMFGAESMFHRVTDASKVAMVAMMEHAERIGVTLIDIQVLTEHTERMGGIEVSREEYLRRLREALGREVDWSGRS
jgi:leucyl/phenylalanyl-tRNA---protein transferase